MRVSFARYTHETNIIGYVLESFVCVCFCFFCCFSSVSFIISTVLLLLLLFIFDSLLCVQCKTRSQSKHRTFEYSQIIGNINTPQKHAQRHSTAEQNVELTWRLNTFVGARKRERAGERKRGTYIVNTLGKKTDELQ